MNQSQLKKIELNNIELFFSKSGTPHPERKNAMSKDFFFTKVKIARNPEGFQVPEVMDMNPTGLPELF